MCSSIHQTFKLVHIGQAPVAVTEVVQPIQPLYIIKGVLPRYNSGVTRDIGTIILINRAKKVGVFSPHKAGQIVSNRLIVAFHSKPRIWPVNAFLQLSILPRACTVYLRAFIFITFGLHGFRQANDRITKCPALPCAYWPDKAAV
jgi:hypothetical protein